MRYFPAILVLCLLPVLTPTAQAQQPDPAGVATGDKTSVVDAAGNSFAPAAPDPSDPDYANKKKAYDEFQAQLAREPLTAKLADAVGHVRIATNAAWTLNTGYLVLFMQAGFALAEIFVGAFLYPIFGCWVWGGGWMSQLGSTMHLGHGYVDFAGSTVVHAVGGFCAMALAVILGPRLGKYDKNGNPRAFPAHNIAFVVIGTFILLFGWMGFNPGSTLGATDLRISVIAVNTNLAAVAASATAMIFWYFVFGKPDISMACNGMLAGLVAITAPCAFVSPNSAVVIGILAGIVVCVGVLFNERVIKVDDPCGAISVHGYCGWLGAVCVGLFADGTYGAGWNGVGATTYLGSAGQGVTGLLYSDTSQFICQLGGATLCALWGFGATYVVFALVNAVKSMRVSQEDELEGLDVPEFGMLAYPEDALSEVK